ncbi:hypothetical protein [Aeromicrobium sp. CnD17-E]|uniref:hypothetical protein n=1 Tax=Aeromicrobium sp. CnD17-E TaxID=2954487 RepID=UPI00209840E2|nr:hypothetical protein [Aeromicrobium sp. CnD17-E]MCO7238692.1 hypothetical protein [Aeromicrobium sp. CnD17-E]
MTEILAGFLGGFLALAGGALVQVLTARSSRRERIARLGTTLLTDGAFAIEDLSIYRKTTGVGARPRALADVRFMPSATAAAVELGLLGGRRLAFQAQAVSGAMNHLTLLAIPGVPDDRWRDAVLDLGEARLVLSHQLRRELGRRRMSDDDLGHDAPDIENPGTTHTQRS